jgi:hypothetical protein
MKRVLSVNPDYKKTTYFHSDADKITIETVQDVTDIVEHNKAKYNSVDERARWGEWARVAQIPLSVYFDLKKQGITEDEAAMKRWLNSPDNRYYRTRPGKV